MLPGRMGQGSGKRKEKIKGLSVLEWERESVGEERRPEVVSKRGKQGRQRELEGQEKNCEGGKGRELGKAKVRRKVSGEIRSGVRICRASGEVHEVSVPAEVGS